MKKNKNEKFYSEKIKKCLEKQNSKIQKQSCTFFSKKKKENWGGGVWVGRRSSSPPPPVPPIPKIEISLEFGFATPPLVDFNTVQVTNMDQFHNIVF